MRISTANVFSTPVRQMASLTARADELQTQISTGNKFIKPSDDATAYLRLQSLKRDGASDTAWEANLKLAQGVLSEGDSALASIETQLQRAKEMVTQAGGIMSDADKKTLAQSIDHLVDDLLVLANSKDVRGHPIFGGATGETAYARNADGSISYVGTGQPPAIPVGEANNVQAGVTGDMAFKAGEDSDMFAVLQALSVALAGGGDIKDALADGMEGIDAALDQVAITRSSIGARAYRLDLEAERFDLAETNREEMRQGIEGVDMSTAISELQKTLTVLQATQASFTKLTSLSLFDYIR